MTVVPHTMSYDGKSAKDRLVEGEAILSDWNAGVRVSDLIERYGLSQATVYRRIDTAIKARLAPTVDAYREAQNALLDDLMGKWGDQLRVADEACRQAMTRESMVDLERGFNLRAKALEGIQRVAERRAKLMGLDAPVKADVKVTVTTPVDAAVAALVGEVEASAASS